MSSAVVFENVSKRFGSQTAVNQLDLTVPTGAIHGFVGPNGSGKTTTLRMILRIFRPDEGTVSVLGSVDGEPADPRLGYLPEERGLYKRMTVRRLLRYYAQLKGVDNPNGAIDKWLTRLDATSFANKQIAALSKGMAQKIQFITAVIGQPQLLILDEPFSGLDPVNMEVLRDAVLHLRDEGITIIFSTHDMDVAERLCDSVFMIFKGNKVLDGTLEQIRQANPVSEIQVRMADNSMPSLPEIETAERRGNGFRLRIGSDADPAALLPKLLSCGPVEHFEVLRPSLHDIFVRIAKPDADAEINSSGE